MVTLTINGQTVQVPAGTTILEAAEKAGIKIPTLCYLKDINKIAACRMCVVEVEGSDRLAPAIPRWRRGWWSTPIPPRSARPGGSIWSCC